jgi:inositol polyphosphate 5-phosphatase INPP5B/F
MRVLFTLPTRVSPLDLPNRPDSLQASAVFWIGDLNYRIDLPGGKVRSAILNGRHLDLLVHDQLFLQRLEGNCFLEFTEAPITFLPTYKYDSGTNTYDTSEKMRDPAWCDRILWMGDAVYAHISYNRHEILSSDHRPVSAVLKVAARTILHNKRLQVQQDIVRRLDQEENEMIPQCHLSSQKLDFGPVRINCPQTRSILLTNQTKAVVCTLALPCGRTFSIRVE